MNSHVCVYSLSVSVDYDDFVRRVLKFRADEKGSASRFNK